MTTGSNGFLLAQFWVPFCTNRSQNRAILAASCVAWLDSGWTFSKIFSAGAILSAILYKSCSKLHCFDHCVVCWEMAFCACSDFLTCCRCLMRIWIKSTVCRVWYEHTNEHTTPIFFSFNLSQHLFFSVCNLKSGQRKMFRICLVMSKFITTYWESVFCNQKDDFSYWQSLFTYKSPYFHTESPF